MSSLLAALPILCLLVAMTSPWPRRLLPLPAHIALPATALLVYGLHRMGGFEGVEASAGPGPRQLHAAVIEGTLVALTPLSILCGAMLFFAILVRSGAMATLTDRLRRLNPDPVVQMVLVGWAFSALIEGLSGFGTPAALAAPILVGLGLPPLRVVAACLALNSVPVSFGAVGTPIWFGLRDTGLDAEALRAVGLRAAIVNGVAAFAIVPAALALVVPWRAVRARLGFVWGVVAATVVPSTAVAAVSVEFPSIVGGACGLAVGAWRARRQSTPAPRPADSRSLTRPAAPLVLVVVLLAVTRIEALGLKSLLNDDFPALMIPLGALGEASIGPNLVVGLREILGTERAWRMAILHVPFLLPFVAVALLSVVLFGLPASEARAACGQTLRRLLRPAIALVGAMVFVTLFVTGEDAAPATVLGQGLAGAAGPAWPLFAPLLGAVGAFFSGSNTVSNLTFAPVQAATAASLGIAPVAILALQTVGGSMGNMVCIHNIVSVAALVDLERDTDGSRRPPIPSVLALTIRPFTLYALIAAAAGAALLI
jgi:lactate permease